jgi:uncharacterized membrane protein
LQGLLWYRHNAFYRYVERISRRMFFLQMLQVATAGFVPFCAALMGRYPVNPISLVMYSGCLAAYQWASCAYWIAAKGTGSLSARLPHSEYLRLRRRSLRGAIAVSLIVAYSVVLAVR